MEGGVTCWNVDHSLNMKTLYFGVGKIFYFEKLRLILERFPKK